MPPGQYRVGRDMHRFYHYYSIMSIFVPTGFGILLAGGGSMAISLNSTRFSFPNLPKFGGCHEWHQNRRNLLAGIYLTGVLAMLASVA